MFLLQEGDTILLESYARIKHLQTKTWLHLEEGMQFSFWDNMQNHFTKVNLLSWMEAVLLLCIERTIFACTSCHSKPVIELFISLQFYLASFPGPQPIFSRLQYTKMGRAWHIISHDWNEALGWKLKALRMCTIIDKVTRLFLLCIN